MVSVRFQFLKLNKKLNLTNHLMRWYHKQSNSSSLSTHFFGNSKEFLLKIMFKNNACTKSVQNFIFLFFACLKNASKFLHRCVLGFILFGFIFLDIH